MMTRIALAQINVTVGDFAGNVARIVAAARAAHNDGAQLMIAPELALSGYPPEDLLLRPAFYAASATALAELAAELKAFDGLAVLVGHPLRACDAGGPGVDGNANRPIERGVPPSDTYNAASLIVGGEIVGTYRKQDLPNAEVFDEKRYFATDAEPFVFELNGVKYGVVICEDAWHASAAQIAKAAGAQVLLIPNGSPYHMNKEAVRMDILRARIRETGLPMVYVNLVGAQDELVFDGGSFVLDAAGELVAKMPQFEEGHAIVAFDGARPLPGAIAPELPLEAQVYRALVMGVRDYIGKNGFPGAIIGLSGGVDSALVLAIACDALGPERVRAVMMPSRFTADISTTDAAEMARRVGVRYDEIAIAPMFDAFRAALAGDFAGLAEDATEENIQARIRGTLLMALSNKFGSIVLTTGNKSEMAVGYCTLYGDMAGGFAVIKDIAKTLVYRLCHYRNAAADYGTRDIIPERILTRAPSAELRENQTDQDSLPPYDVLDAIMRMYMEEDRPLAEIVAAGYAEADVARVTRLIKINEYKRRQAPIGIRVTHRAFGRDWRYPITSRFTERLD
ncbi:NAD+ synthase [Burkholderia stagnalis]|uniref:Glutamine-dependent NAD(+) synthetase n=1 Tax=Burkholderia stagnalis TaxID=1503054 RepID=A0A3P0EYU4_9BURK|nr:NAD+ synthase [Burkholderia stagnalis]AOK54434.1 NAD synthetase [Burkholderia stagnalis]KAB0640577.1 NAD+ synthase [Burkholderia stagnalis]KVC53957.1 NAD synthetase [Burkholderia stagnalis]KVD89079.1 NAD synthetase [Burkholderia stagnalis]KVL89499.1 NAD synthetase [Burkholderia stagnalis]